LADAADDELDSAVVDNDEGPSGPHPCHGATDCIVGESRSTAVMG
jgi:hypothetical protein